MNKIIDLHHHLNSLHPFFALRSKWQSHKISPTDYLRPDHKVIIGLALYPQFYHSYSDLIKLIQKMKKEITDISSEVQIITRKSDLDKEFSLGIVLHIESARVIKNPKIQVKELFDLGVRGLIPVHFIDNIHGNSCDDFFRRFGIKKHDAGLTETGYQLVEACNKEGIWLDLSHSSEETGEDLIKYADHVMISHVGVREIKNLARNKDLSLLNKIKNKNGVIGICPWSHLIGDSRESYQKQWEFLIASGLSKHIGIGSDFGAPIKTHPSITSSIDLAKIAHHFPDHSQDLTWNNSYQFLRGVLK